MSVGRILIEDRWLCTMRGVAGPLANAIELQSFWAYPLQCFRAGGVTAVRPLAMVPARFTALVAEFFASGPTASPQTRFWRWNCAEPPGGAVRQFALVCGKDGPAKPRYLEAVGAVASAEPYFFPVPTYLDSAGRATTWRVFVSPTVYFDLRRWHMVESRPTERPDPDYWGFVSEPVLIRAMISYLADPEALAP